MTMLLNATSIITLALSFLLGLYVYISNRKNSVNRIFILLLMSAMFWIFSNFMANISEGLPTIYLWSKLTIIGPIFIGYFFYRLAIAFPRRKTVPKSHVTGLTILVCALLTFIPT